MLVLLELSRCGHEAKPRAREGKTTKLEIESLTLNMDLQTRKLQFIEEILAISNEQLMNKLESVLRNEQQKLDPELKEKLSARALKANDDIKEGRVYSREEAEAKIKERMGI